MNAGLTVSESTSEDKLTEPLWFRASGLLISGTIVTSKREKDSTLDSVLAHSHSATRRLANIQDTHMNMRSLHRFKPAIQSFEGSQTKELMRRLHMVVGVRHRQYCGGDQACARVSSAGDSV